jgi:hypothetical protein
MKENIYFSSLEGQEFQEKPHVSLMPSQGFIGTWRIDLCWREDVYSIGVDAQFNFVDGMDLENALKEAIDYGEILNVPVTRYDDVTMHVLFKPEDQSSKDQEKRLQFVMHSSSTQRFHTH